MRNIIYLLDVLFISFHAADDVIMSSESDVEIFRVLPKHTHRTHIHVLRIHIYLHPHVTVAKVLQTVPKNKHDTVKTSNDDDGDDNNDGDGTDVKRTQFFISLSFFT